MTSAMGPSPLGQGDGPRVGVSSSSFRLGMKLSQVPLSPVKTCYLGGPLETVAIVISLFQVGK